MHKKILLIMLSTGLLGNSFNANCSFFDLFTRDQVLMYSAVTATVAIIGIAGISVNLWTQHSQISLTQNQVVGAHTQQPTFVTQEQYQSLLAQLQLLQELCTQEQPRTSHFADSAGARLSPATETNGDSEVREITEQKSPHDRTSSGDSSLNINNSVVVIARPMTPESDKER